MKGWLTAFAAFTALASAQSVPDTPQPQGSVPPQLQELRLRLSESLTVADRAATAQWIASLTELEKSRASSGDYEGAQRARTKREEILAAAGAGDGRVPILLETKNLTNKGPGLIVGETQGTATFRSKGAFIEWDLTGKFDGWYEVRLTHAVAGGSDASGGIRPVTGPVPASYAARKNDPDYYPPAAGGWVAFQDTSSLGISKTVLRREIVSTGGWNSWRTVSLGRLELGSTRLARLRLTGEEVAREGLMHFRRIELIPASAPPASSNSGEAKLTALRESFRKSFRARTGGSVAAYKSSLTALEQQAARSKDSDLLYRVREELKQLNQSPELLLLSSDATLAAMPTVISLPAGHTLGTTSRGDIVFDNARSVFTKLKPAGEAGITWRLSAFNVRSGVYEVALKGVVPVTGGGNATLAAFGASSVPAGEPLRFEVKPVVSPDQRHAKPESGAAAPTPDRRTEEPGKLIIGKGAQTLTLTVTGLTHADGWLMDLAGITLTRTGDIPDKNQP